jgi:glycerol-1-phosphate dehydrogenase [NAD(P)+]
MTQRIVDLADYLSRDSSRLSDSSFSCPYCGRSHTIPIKNMRVGSGLVSSIPDLAQKILGKPPRLAGIVFDRQIEEIIQEKVITPLSAARLPLTLLPFGQKGLLLDSEIAIGDQAAADLDPKIDILIGAGSGVICDLTKWIATKKNIPYILYGTAPSMNAYTSITATMTEHDIKTSYFLNPSDAVLLDTDILVDAPMKMIHAGIGDLAARAICNADWKLAQVLSNAYFCPLPYEFTAENERKYLDAAAGIRARDPQSIQILSEAVMMSGLSMTVLEGETSPSSGAEHVISHFWDLLMHLRGLPKNLHGAQVGIGTVIMIAFYNYMRAFDPSHLDIQAILRTRPTMESIIADNNATYAGSAFMFNEVVRKKYLSDQALIERIHFIQANWEKMWKELDPYVPTLDSIRKPMLEAGVPLSISSIHRTKAEAVEALVKGPQYRMRYTLLDLATELGILPNIAEEILQLAGVL